MEEREEEILALIDKRPGLTEKEIAKELLGPDGVQQNVNPRCRALVEAGFVRRVGQGGPGDPYRYWRSSTRGPDDAAAEIDYNRGAATLAGSPAIHTNEADNTDYDPDSVSNNRERAMRAICIRRGQLAFRRRLMAAYNFRCAMTGCNVQDVLEAAHILPFNGSSSDHVCNGLLLRADIHTLFDCGLLAFDPKTRVAVLADSLMD